MIEYRIIVASSPEALTEDVSAFLNNHWSCVGGVHTYNSRTLPLASHTPDVIVFCQAVQKGSATSSSPG